MKTDSELQKDVMHELRYDPIVDASATDIGVIASDGAITLTGQVNTYAKKLAAEKAAKRVKGVKVVALDIDVVPPGDYAHTDTDIARAVKDALKWHAALEEGKIQVKVEGGWVYLDGDVYTNYQKQMAEHTIENLLSIKGIVNRIKIISHKRLDVNQLKKEISAAYHRNATIDSKNITIEMEGSKVILRGKVHSWRELDEAEKCAWKAPGVTAVENKIEIDFGVFV